MRCPGIYFVVRRDESFFSTPRAAVCLVVNRVGSFSYTARASKYRVYGWWGVCLTRPVMESVFVQPRRLAGGVFLLHAPCWKQQQKWSKSGWGVSLTRPVLSSV